VVNVRIYQNMIAEPQDMIDPRVMAAVDALMTAYSGDFELGGTVRAVDLLGMAGTPMAAQAGYIQQDNRVYRAVTITLPLSDQRCLESGSVMAKTSGLGDNFYLDGYDLSGDTNSLSKISPVGRRPST
jgi:hypothetical protein